MKKILLAIIFLMVCFCVNASTLPYVSLSWDANPEPELVGYTLYSQEADGSFLWIDDIDEDELSNPLLPRWTVQGMQPRDFYYLVITARSDTAESDYSDDACGKLIPGYDHYVPCDYQKPSQPKKKNSGGSSCFISTIQ